MKKILFPILVVASLSAFAANEADFDSLGGNTILLERAKALNPEVSTSIIQERLVPRRNRLEMSTELSGTFGGDTYSRTHSVGLNAQFHINPQWSVGLKVNQSYNRLTTEGNAMLEKATADFQKNPQNPTSRIPDLDYPLQETMALVNWYPIYGKMSLLEKSVAHFDIYGLLGAGNVSLKSGGTQTWTTGAGFALWLTPHFTTRLEMRYQSYQAKYYSGPQDLDLTVGSVQMGWLL